MVIAYFVNLGKKFFKTQYFLSKITKRKKKRLCHHTQKTLSPEGDYSFICVGCGTVWCDSLLSSKVISHLHVCLLRYIRSSIQMKTSSVLVSWFVAPELMSMEENPAFPVFTFKMRVLSICERESEAQFKSFSPLCTMPFTNGKILS